MTAMRELARDPACSPYWQLALAYGGMAEGTAHLRQGESEAAFVGRHLAAARQLAPGQPAVGLIEGLHLIASAQDYRRALPLLEAAAGDPALANAELVFQLWVCRIHAHGAVAALAMPFVPASSGVGCYIVGVQLNDELDALLPGGVSVAPEAAAALGARYYEAGLARFEAFVLHGVGNMRDGDAHAYSMLCNNLAIHYRDQDQTAAALALHYKGIAASPFAEHYSGVMQCHRRSGDDAAMVDAAERLWHFTADFGYSRHDPCDYIDDAAAGLHRLGRDTEIAIWLQRLDEWIDSVAPDERPAYEKSYVRALLTVLHNMAYSQPEDALLRLEPVLARVAPLACPYISAMAGHALRVCAQPERAQVVYASALRHIRVGQDWDESQRKPIVDGMDACRRLQRAAQPWWKVW